MLLFHFTLVIFSTVLIKLRVSDEGDNPMQGLFIKIYQKSLPLAIKAKQELREKQWELHFNDYGRGVSIYRTNELSTLILQGVPDSLRREVWMIFSGAYITPHYSSVR